MIKLDERELRLVANCHVYAEHDPAGLPGHALMMVVHKLASLLQGPPVCTVCWQEMVRTHYQNEEGDWFVCWLCGCEPDARVIEEAQRVARGN